MLTDHQIAILAQGMLAAWDIRIRRPMPRQRRRRTGITLLAIRCRGEKTFAIFCARCHGAGIASNKSTHTGSIVDPTYLALVSDQSLRSTIIAGLPERGMPDWRSDQAGPSPRSMTDREIADTVAWLASHRVATPGQPYPKSQ